MGRRGRKVDANAIACNGHDVRTLLQPPDHLSEREARLFHELVMLAPPSQFSASDVYSTFVQVTALLEDAGTAAHQSEQRNA